MHAAVDYILWRSATLQEVFCYMYKFYMHIKCVYSLSMFTLQRNETDNIHNDIYIICMRDVKWGIFLTSL